MSLNGPSGMYKLKPIYDVSETVQLPECMYKMASVYQGGEERGDKLTELEHHQEQILNRLEELKSHIQQMKNELTGSTEYNQISSSMDASRFYGTQEGMTTIQDAVITASPHHPPLSVWVLYHLSTNFRVRLTTYLHSTSDKECDLISKLKMENRTEVNDSYNLGITLIWKEVGKDPELMVSPTLQSKVTGEVNLARYLARVLNSGYEEGDAVTATQIDNWLDLAHSSFFHGNNKERQAVIKAMNVCLGKSDYLVGNNLSIADIILWSALIQSKLTSSLPANVNKWWKMLNNISVFSMLSDFVLN